MRKFLTLIVFMSVSLLTWGQSSAQSCDKKSCGPEGTKKEEAAVITTMRTDLQSVIEKMSKSTFGFDKQVVEMTIGKGTSDDESLLYLSQAVTSVRYELLNRLESSRMISSLKDFKPTAATTKQQMVSNLKKEIQILASQAEKL